jgi:hypothetical protein
LELINIKGIIVMKRMAHQEGKKEIQKDMQEHTTTTASTLSTFFI